MSCKSELAVSTSMSAGNKRKDVSYENSQQDDEESYTDIDNVSDQTDASEEGNEEDEEIVNSFIAPDGEQNQPTNAFYRQIQNQLDEQQQSTSSDEDIGPITYEEPQEGGFVLVQDNDPEVYRVIVRPGTPQLVAYIMYQIVINNLKKQEAGLAKYKYNIISVSASPNDEEGVYVEAYEKQYVIALAGNKLLRRYVLPFQRDHYTMQPITKRRIQLQVVHRLDPKDEQPFMFKKHFTSTQEHHPGDYVLVRRIGVRHAGVPSVENDCVAVVLEAMDGKLRVAMKTPFRSLMKTNPSMPHRIQRDEYNEQEREEDYDKISLFGKYEYLEGLLVLWVKDKHIRPVPADRIHEEGDLQLTRFGGRTADPFQNETLPMLEKGNIVKLLGYKENDIDLTGTECEIVDMIDNYTYSVRIKRCDDKNLCNQLLSVERFQLIYFPEIGSHIQVNQGKLRGYTGHIVRFKQDENTQRLFVIFKADITGEYVNCQDVYSDYVHCVSENRRFQGHRECMLDGRLLRLYDLVQCVQDTGTIRGIITYMLDKRVIVHDDDNQDHIVSLTDCQQLPRYMYGKSAQDGSKPPKTIMCQSKVQKHGTQKRGVVQAIMKQQAGSILFVRATQGETFYAWPAAECEQQEPGRILEQERSKQSSHFINKAVILSDSSHNGKRGVIVSHNTKTNQFRVKLNDQGICVSVDARCVVFVMEEGGTLGDAVRQDNEQVRRDDMQKKEEGSDSGDGVADVWGLGQ